jgi:peroxiredoxin Q/BCP
VTHRLSQYAGRPVILYFYPKDDTLGCTKEACAFQASLPSFKTRKAAVLGVSILDEASKAKFARKYGLGFPLPPFREPPFSRETLTTSAALA